MSSLNGESFVNDMTGFIKIPEIIPKANAEIAYATRTHKIIFSQKTTEVLFAIDESVRNQYIQTMITRGELVIKGLPPAKNNQKNRPCICGSGKKRKKCCK